MEIAHASIVRQVGDYREPSSATTATISLSSFPSCTCAPAHLRIQSIPLLAHFLLPWMLQQEEVGIREPPGYPRPLHKSSFWKVAAGDSRSIQTIAGETGCLRVVFWSEIYLGQHRSGQLQQL